MKTLALLCALSAAFISPHALAHGSGKHTPAAAIQPEQKAWGIAGTPGGVSRTIEVTMSDTMRFSPDTISVTLGDTVKFIVKNAGGVMHEMVIGTREELEAHAEMMKKFPNMEHDEPYMAHVGSNASGEIIWTFNRPGQFAFACLIPGHFTAGMKGTIHVSEAAHWARAEVRSIDVANKKITLKHGEIKNLDMPPMTMVFYVYEPARFEGIKAGDTVRFQAEKTGPRYIVKHIELAK